MDPLPELVVADGLVLRRWTVADAAVLEALVTDNAEHLRPYMPWVAELPLGLEGRRRLLETWEQEWLAGTEVSFGIFAPDGDAVAGACGLHRRIGPTGLEIGYWVDRHHLGQGVARRASAALTSVALRLDEIDHIEIHHDLTNVRSRRIPEQLGFRHVGQRTLDRELAPAETGIELVWRMTREEWAAR